MNGFTVVESAANGFTLEATGYKVNGFTVEDPTANGFTVAAGANTADADATGFTVAACAAVCIDADADD